MRPEARPIEFANGHAHFYGKKKVDSFSIFRTLVCIYFG